MKKLLIISLAFLISFASCVSSKRQFQKGRYDEAIRLSTKRLLKNPKKEKEIVTLDRAYKYAMLQDNERIDFLRKSGQPEVWEEIFLTYTKMKNRQETIRVLSPFILQRIGFVSVNYDNEIIEAKKKAAEFLYAHAMRLLDDGGRQNARRAYDQLLRVRNYYPSFRDVESQIQRALQEGTSYVLFNIRNNTGIPLPPNFEKEIQRMSLSDLNTKWIRYETRKVENRSYDYFILLNIRMIDVTPESVKEIHYTETKEVDDGFQYVLDNNGNVLKDSLGNDIKVPKTKTISCHIVETQLHKAVTISGTIDFINVLSSQTIRTSPITSQFFFNHMFAVAHGDRNALKPATRDKLRSGPVPFPNDFEMIMGAADILKSMSRDIVRQNRNIIY